MSSMSQKNMMLSPAAMDLGLGAQLQMDVENGVEDQKKKLRQRLLSMGKYSAAGVSLMLNPVVGDE